MKHFARQALFIACLILVGAACVITYMLWKTNIEWQNTDQRFFRWQQAALQLRDTSEALTFQAREYARTRDSEYAHEYLSEVFHRRSRESAMNVLYEASKNKPEGAELLSRAVEASDDLAKKELYAMRLLALALNDSIEDLNRLTGDTRITSADMNLPREEKIQRAKELLFDSSYDADRNIIMHSIADFQIQGIELCAQADRKFAEIVDRFLMAMFVCLLLIICCVMIGRALNPPDNLRR